MTYCIAASVRDGLVFVSDSRTNAGIDQLGSFSKMHPFDDLPDRFLTLLSAGNLATTQAVVAELHRDIRDGAPTSLASIRRIREGADYIGQVSRKVQEKYTKREKDKEFAPNADFIFGGKIGSDKHAIFHIYTEGNYVTPTKLAPFVQIGEQKYGRPILDRIIRMDTDLDTVARCGLVSMDSTMRCNASVGPPIELMIYRVATPSTSTHIVFEEDDPYLRSIRDAWSKNLQIAFDNLPPLKVPGNRMKLVDRD